MSLDPRHLPKICVALAADSVDELMRTSAANLPEFPFQELRLDSLPDPGGALPALSLHLQRYPSATWLITCRRRASGGLFEGSPAAELAILTEAAQRGFPLVDLALESAEALPAHAVAQLRAAGAAVSVSWHDFNGTPDLQAVVKRIRGFAPDLCKIVPTAITLADTLALLDLLRNAQVPTVAVAMGEAGTPSRILGVRSGSAFTFAAAAAKVATAPGQIDARTLRDRYRIDRIGLTTRIFGVAGHPLRSSLSPVMLNAAFAANGSDAVYLPLLTRSAGELFRVAQELPLAGFSVTMPLKQDVLPILHNLDPLAAKIGAVNTVRREPDGSFTGFNTDAAGITSPLLRRLDLRGARVLVLGAGGAARAAVFACKGCGAQVSILNRTADAGERLAREVDAQAVRRADLTHLPTFDVLLNATPAGMRGNPTEMPLEAHELNAKLVFDLVYNPLETPLLLAARSRGLETIAGVEMFVHQGARQFELWTGEQAPLETMQAAVLEALASR